MNILALNIEVKTVKNLKVSIDFQNLTRDRLFGEVSADIVIRSDSGRLRTRGEIDIVGNSYYRFYRDFKVKDSRIIFHGPINRPELDIRAVYENTKSTEQYGSITSSPIQVVLTVTGNPNNPEITLKLYENGTEMFGNDATSDAITFLLFGKYKNELSASETQSLASGIGSTVGSLYVTSFVGQILRNMLPFIQDAELNYTEGVIRNTNASVTSEILDAQVTVGSRMIDNTGYLEYNVEYPINNFVTLNLPEKLILLIAREQLSRNVISNSNVYYSTGAKVLYKLKF
jgi:autotransporter translocation and assembly factor TamB